MDEFAIKTKDKKMKGSFFHVLLCQLPPENGTQI